MFTIRTHPQVISCLHGPAPQSFQGHVDYLSRVKDKDFFLLKVDGKLCGYCQRTHLDKEIELGWAIHPDYWGQGIGNDSVQELVDQSLHFAKNKSDSGKIISKTSLLDSRRRRNFLQNAL
jgi:RimJ/RimL family protein N-acetyltransferase